MTEAKAPTPVTDAPKIVATNTEEETLDSSNPAESGKLTPDADEVHTSSNPKLSPDEADVVTVKPREGVAVAPVVNELTQSILADKDIKKTTSLPGVQDLPNPLAVSERSQPLDYFPTLESRGYLESEKAQAAEKKASK